MEHDDIDYQQSLLDVQEEKITSNPDKVAYSSPALTIYGSVSSLTMGTGGTKTDPGVNMTKLV